MPQQFIDDNGVTNFIDDNGVVLFIDDNGIYLGTPPSIGSPPPAGMASSEW